MKNNTKIILIVIVSLLVVGLGGYLIYDKVLKNDEASDNGPDTNITTRVNSELHGAISFAMLSSADEAGELTDTLVAITETGQEIEIYEWKGFSSSHKSYFVYDEKVYLQECFSEANESFIGAIDLTAGNGNYEVTKLIEFEQCNFLEFTVVGENIYYKNNLFNEEIHVFNMTTKEAKLFIEREIPENKNAIAISHLFSSSENNVLFYRMQIDGMPNAEHIIDREMIVFAYNLDNNEETEVCRDCSVEFIHNGKLIYYVPRHDASDYYEYDIETGNSRSILAREDGSWSISDRKIMPFENGYMYIVYDYVDETTEIFTIDSNLAEELIHTFEDFIPTVVLKSSKNSVMFSMMQHRMDDDTTIETRELNLDTKDVTSRPNLFYSFVQPVSFR